MSSFLSSSLLPSLSLCGRKWAYSKFLEASLLASMRDACQRALHILIIEGNGTFWGQCCAGENHHRRLNLRVEGALKQPSCALHETSIMVIWQYNRWCVRNRKHTLFRAKISITTANHHRNCHLCCRKMKRMYIKWRYDESITKHVKYKYHISINQPIINNNAAKIYLYERDQSIRLARALHCCTAFFIIFRKYPCALWKYLKVSWLCRFATFDVKK